jgi:membrane fusion protein (multidrug efflux system)
VPLSAIVYNPYGNAVYVVEQPGKEGGDLIVRQQFVQTGATRGDQVAVTQGREAGRCRGHRRPAQAAQRRQHRHQQQVTPSNSARPRPIIPEPR